MAWKIMRNMRRNTNKEKRSNPEMEIRFDRLIGFVQEDGSTIWTSRSDLIKRTKNGDSGRST